MSRGIAQGKARGKLRTDFGDGPLRGTWRQPRFAWQKVQPLDVINFLFRQFMQFSLPGGWAKGKKAAHLAAKTIQSGAILRIAQPDRPIFAVRRCQVHFREVSQDSL